MNGENKQRTTKQDVTEQSVKQPTLLQAAICKNDLEQVKKILSQLDGEQRKRELIRTRLEFTSNLSLALFFDRTRRIATYILRFVVQPEKLEEDTVASWFEIFELTEKMYRHFKSHLTSKRMANELLGLNLFAKSGELVLNDLVSRPKFFKAAWTLGAKYVPKHLGDSFASHVYWSQDITRPDKRSLFEWMGRVGMYKTNPFDIEAQAELVAERNTGRIDYLMQLPREKECDEQGYNLFHWAAYKGKLSFWRAINHYRDQLKYPRTIVVDMLLQKNVNGVTPLAIYLIKFAPAKCVLFLKEVRHAVRKVVKTEALDLIEPVFKSHLMKTCKPLFFYLYSLGVTSDKFLKAFGDGYINPFEDIVATHANYNPPNDEPKEIETYNPTAPPLNMNELPPELIYEVAMLLSPEEAFNLFTVSKKLTKVLRQSNEVFWTKYHSLHYGPLSAPCPSLKQRVILEVRGRSNWQSSKYHDLVFKKRRYSAMDDNWIILSSDNSKKAFNKLSPLTASYHYFNCHTQQIHDGLLNTQELLHPSLILSNYNYTTTPGPVYFSDSYPEHYRIVRGQDLIDCKAVQEFMVGRPQEPHFFVNYELIDHRMFISERSAIYDPEYDKITGTLSTQPKFHHTARQGTYLPYSKQIYRISDNFEVELYDLNYKRVATLPYSDQYTSVPQQVDEHTLFFHEKYEDYQNSGFLDLRTNQFVEYLDDHIKVGSLSQAMSLNGERVVFTHPMLHVITSWNLRTRRWEFVDDNKLFPSACNLRYLVGTYGDSVVIRDFCSNAIKCN